jgi:glycosyltransferase involved in cell wall biosynthesis
MQQSAWVSFCISTYKRPEILRQQLQLLSKQTFAFFEVIISDNDPEASARDVVSAMGDDRFKYFHNAENLGMIKSFNESVRRSQTDFIVMVTDDDPIDENFLMTMHGLYKKYPELSAYCGFLRQNKKDGEVEIIPNVKFVTELLDPGKTYNHLWSSAVLRKKDVLEVGIMPDYGSPHLADHALIALVGNRNGAVILNKVFSSLSSHDSNFSKFNFNYYVDGCKGFYEFLTNRFNAAGQPKNNKIVMKHLHAWFITNMFALKKYYTLNRKDEVLKQLEDCARKILAFDFMKQCKTKYYLKIFIFYFKQRLNLLR